MHLFSSRPVVRDVNPDDVRYLRRLGLPLYETELSQPEEESQSVFIDTLEDLRALAMHPAMPGLRRITINVLPNPDEPRQVIDALVCAILERYRGSEIERFRAQMPVEWKGVWHEIKKAKPQTPWKLRELDLILDGETYEDVEEVDVEELLADARDLTAVWPRWQIKRNESLPDFLRCIASTCPKMEALLLTFHINHDFEANLSETLGPALWAYSPCPKLKVLVIDGVNLFAESKHGIDRIAKHWGKSLRILHIAPKCGKKEATPVGKLCRFNPSQFPNLLVLGLRVNLTPEYDHLPDPTPLSQLRVLDIGTSLPPRDDGTAITYFSKLVPNARLVDAPPEYRERASMETKDWGVVILALAMPSLDRP